MSGFKNFLLRGNLIELAVAFVIGGAFATVVKSFVTVIMDLVGKAGGSKTSFSAWVPGGVHVGDFITALIAFIILAAVVYFGVVLPYEKAKERFFPEPEAGDPEELAVLKQIRDSLANR